MPAVRRRALAFAAALLLAAPAGALAQSAGDEQYEDPFGGGQEQPQPTPEPEPAPAAAQPTPAPASEPAAPPAAQPAAAQPGESPAELPRTGLDARLILLAGALLLAGGVALRARLRA